MATVFLAVDSRIKDRQVAIKLLIPNIAASESMRRRFISEAEVIAALEHPAIVP